MAGKWKSEDNLGELTPSFHYTGSVNWAQVVRLKGSASHPLSYLSNLRFLFLNTSHYSK